MKAFFCILAIICLVSTPTIAAKVAKTRNNQTIEALASSSLKLVEINASMVPGFTDSNDRVLINPSPVEINSSWDRAPLYVFAGCSLSKKSLVPHWTAAAFYAGMNGIIAHNKPLKDQSLAKRCAAAKPPMAVPDDFSILKTASSMAR